MQGSSLVVLVEDHDALLACYRGAGLVVGQWAHQLASLLGAHLLVQNPAVSGEEHATHIVRGKGGVANLHPWFVLAVLIHDARTVVGHHLRDTDALGSLCPGAQRGDCQHA